jgi:hypothetical protein
MLGVIMKTVVMLGVVMLSVVAPVRCPTLVIFSFDEDGGVVEEAGRRVRRLTSHDFSHYFFLHKV